MSRKAKPPVESIMSNNTAETATTVRTLVDLQHELLARVATGLLDRSLATPAFLDLQRRLRTVCAIFGDFQPPFPWASLEPWYWEANSLGGNDLIENRLIEYRARIDAALAVLTGEPRWTLIPFEDGRASFATDLRDLDGPKIEALKVALDEILAVQGAALIGTKWVHKVVDGDGLYEFRIDNEERQIRARTGSGAAGVTGGENVEVDVLVRVFFIFDGPRVILLLSAYDKGEDDSRPRQGREIEEARRRAKRFRSRRVVRSDERPSGRENRPRP